MKIGILRQSINKYETPNKGSIHGKQNLRKSTKEKLMEKLTLKQHVQRDTAVSVYCDSWFLREKK
jgi:hypothetical protein